LKRSSAYGLVVLGWIILLSIGLAAWFGPDNAIKIPAAITIVGVGLGCFLTAIIVAINERWPR
jgi:hypothetical protein